MKYGELNLGQIEALVNKLGGMTAVEGILRGDNLRDSIAKLITPAFPVYTVTVDRDKKLKAMIEAGRYDWTNSDITDQRFPVEGSGTEPVEIILRHYDKVMSTDAVLADLDKDGLRPIRIEELLALGADPKTRDLQREFPIIALASVWRDAVGDRRVACLFRGASERRLVLGSVGNGWVEFCRFAAVRKS